jgi:hypothetical protein
MRETAIASVEEPKSSASQPTDSTSDGGKLTVRDRWFLTGILGLASFLRLYNLELINWSNDDGYHGMVATHILTAEIDELPLAGFPSVGIRNSALFVYLLASANLLAFHPLSGAVLIAVLNIWALYLAFQLSRHHFGKMTAFLALACCTISPWSVIYARSMWPPSCLAPLCLIFIGWTLTWERTGRGLFRVAVLALVIPQMHFSGACAVFWLLFVLFTSKRTVPWKPLTAGALIGLIAWTPWFVFQSITNWIDFRTALHVAEGKNSAFETLGSILLYLYAQLGASQFDYWFDSSGIDMSAYFSGGMHMAQFCAGALMATCWIAAMIRGVFLSRERTTMLLIVWTLIPVVCLTLIRPRIVPHYVLVAFPVPLILTADWIVRVAFGHRSKLNRNVSLVVLAGIAVVFLKSLIGWHGFVDDDHLNGGRQYRRTYRMVRETAVSLVQDADGVHAELVGPVSGIYPAYNYVFEYEQGKAGIYPGGQASPLLFWVDEERLASASLTEEQLTDQEARINRSLATYRPSPFQWHIVRHWSTHLAQVYQLEPATNAP